MDLGTDYSYAGAPLALQWSLTRGLLDVTSSGIRCLLCPGSLVTEWGAEPFFQAGDNACQL